MQSTRQLKHETPAHAPTRDSIAFTVDTVMTREEESRRVWPEDAYGLARIDKPSKLSSQLGDRASTRPPWSRAKSDHKGVPCTGSLDRHYRHHSERASSGKLTSEPAFVGDVISQALSRICTNGWPRTAQQIGRLHNADYFSLHTAVTRSPSLTTLPRLAR